MFLSKFSVSEPAAEKEKPEANENSSQMESSTHSLLSLMSGLSSNKSVSEKQSSDKEPARSPSEDAKLINEALVKNRGYLYWRFPPEVFQILAYCSPKYRQKIINAYYRIFRVTLANEIKNLTKPFSIFRTAIVAVATPLADFYAQELHKALSGLFFKDNVDLVEMLSTIWRQDLIDANYAYWLRYSVSLEFDIKHNIFGFFQRLLVNLSLPRRQSLPVCQDDAKEDAAMLHKAGADKTPFIKVFTTRSFAQLNLIFDEYKIISGCSIEISIVRHFNRKLKLGLLHIVKIARGKISVMAETLYRAFKDKKMSKIVRLLRIHSEHKEDLQGIDQYLLRRRGTSVRKLIQKDCSGDFKKLLLALLGKSSEIEQDADYTN